MKNFRNILALLILCVSFTAFSQDTYFQKGDAAIEAQATEITDRYNAKLGLRAKQELLFRKKVEEYMIRAEQIKKDFTGKDMLDELLKNQQNETAEMGDILTQNQMDVYKENKPIIQPLATVEK